MWLLRKECQLRTRLLKLTEALPDSDRRLSKYQIRKLHEQQRYQVLAKLDGSFGEMLSSLERNLARTQEVDILNIAPHLIPVNAGTPESLLFHAATLYWSVPVSEGFGRRMRFIVMDKNNGKLVGIIGLMDPVFNLGPRDQWIGWSCDDRKERLVHTMDAFILGAMPPYNRILGGKLVALLACSREVVKHFREKYATSKGNISNRRKNPNLVLLTTTSALGRSSQYNRLRIPGSIEFLTEVDSERVSTWYTKGYGHFHISEEAYQALVDVLARRHHPYVRGNRFGDGPNWKIRVIRAAAAELGIGQRLLMHGIRRQVYLVPLATNTRSFLLGKSKVPRYKTLPIIDITEFWRERWALPRSERYPDWVGWEPRLIIRYLKKMRSKASKKES
jgi:hypothetical protein